MLDYCTCIHALLQSVKSRTTADKIQPDLQRRRQVDPLEPRILYSADHPLGLGLLFDDSANSFAELQQDRESAQHLLAQIEQLPPVADDPAATELHPAQPIEQALDETRRVLAFGEIEELPMMQTTLDDWHAALATIVVSTVDDVHDAPDISAYSNLMADKGPDGEISLREAVLVANADPLVTLISVPDGLYVLDMSLGVNDEDAARRDDLDLAGNYVIQGESQSGTVIQQNASDRVFEILSGEVTITDLTVDGGIFEQEAAGAIYSNPGTTLDLINVRIQDSGSHLDAGSLYVGGLVNLDSVSIEDSQADDGGAIFIASTGTLIAEGLSITGANASGNGGGIANYGTLSLKDATIFNNSASVFGGGIYSEGVATVQNSSVTANTAGYSGGGIATNSDANSISITYVTVSGNTGGASGGLRLMGDATVEHTTVVDNTASSGVIGRSGGVLLLADSDGNQPFFSNSVIADNQNNSVFVNHDDVDGTLISGGYNLIQDTNGLTYTNTDVLGLDPVLDALTVGTNGLATHAPLAGSPLINAAARGVFDKAANGQAVDAIPDIGAHEAEIAAGTVFWSDGSNTIFRSDASLSNAQTILSGLDEPLDVKVDAAYQRVFWLEKNTHQVKSALFDGSEVISHFIAPDNAVAIATDGAKDRIFVALGGALPEIVQYQLGLPSAEQQTSLYNPASEPTDLFFDTSISRLQYTQNMTYDDASLSLLDVPSPEQYPTGFAWENIYSPSLLDPVSITVDQGTHTVYWLDSGGTTVGRQVGGEGSDIYTNSVLPSMNNPDGDIAYDSLNDRLILTSPVNSTVYTLNTDLSDTQKLSTTHGALNSVAYYAVADGTNPVNARPFLTANETLSLMEGGGQIITNDDLFAYAADTANSDLLYSITALTQGFSVMKSGLAVTQFSQQDLIDGLISVQDDGEHVGTESSWVQSFTFSVSDAETQTSSYRFTAAVLNIDDAPETVIGSALTVVEGSSVPILSSQLSANDPDTAPADLVFSVSDQADGVVTLDGDAVASFTLQDINAGRVGFTHDGSEPLAQAGFSIALADASTTLDKLAIALNVTPDNDAPQLTLSQNESINRLSDTLINTLHIHLLDVDTPATELVYELSGTELGEVIIDGESVSQFTHQDVLDDRVYFRYTGPAGDQQARMHFTMTDRLLDPVAHSLSLRVADTPPSLSVNDGHTVVEGDRIVLGTAQLVATDTDTLDEDLLFSVSGQSGGVIQVDGVAVSTFSQTQLLDARVSFVHDGSEPSVPVSITVSLSDGASTAGPATLNFQVDPVNDNSPEALDHAVNLERGQITTTLLDGAISVLQSVTDNDEGPDTFTAVQLTEPSHGDLLLRADGSFEYSHDGTETFNDQFDYFVVDSAGNESEPATVFFSISGNHTPVAVGSLADKQSYELEALDLTLSPLLFNDADTDDTLTLQVSTAEGAALPAWLEFDAATNKLTGIPDDGDTGDLLLQVTAVDSQGAQSGPVYLRIQIIDINQPPLITTSTPYSVGENRAGDQAGVITIADPDAADRLLIELSDDRFEFIGNTLQLKPDVSVDHEIESMVDLTVEVSDNAGSRVLQNLTVNVEDHNDAPVAIRENLQWLVKEGADQELNHAAFFDQDGDALTFSLLMSDGAELPDWLIYDKQARQISVQDWPDQQETQNLILRASDGRDGEADIDVSVTFEPQVQVNLSPALPGEVPEPTVMPVEVPEPTVMPVEVAEQKTASESLEFVSIPTFSLPEARTQSTNILTVSTLSSDVATGSALINNGVEDTSAIFDAFVELMQTELSLELDTSGLLVELNAGFQDSENQPFIAQERLGSSDGRFSGSLFADGVDIVNLLSAAKEIDSRLFTDLSQQFESHRDAFESQTRLTRLIIGSSFTMTSGLSLGYMLYLIRGGAIVSSLLTSLPAWRFVDPLPILSNSLAEQNQDNESLQSIVRHSKPPGQ